MIARNRMYGLEVALFCPVCKRELPMYATINYADSNNSLTTLILATHVAHKKAGPCDPTLNWMPEQMGYITAQLPAYQTPL